MPFGSDVAPRSWNQQFPRADTAFGQNRKQAFHHSKTSLGATGHWIHMFAVAAPLVIGEVIKDPEKRWRALRLTSVAAALASEAVWTHRLATDRHKDIENKEALANCADRHR